MASIPSGYAALYESGQNLTSQMVPHPPKQALYKGIDEHVKPPPMENQMQDDERCCGTGNCLIDATGRCWCGQQWDGEKMCAPAPEPIPAPDTPAPNP